MDLFEEKNTEDVKLFESFPPVSTETWEALIQKDLKGADYVKKLVWKTMEGFDVKPYYREEDLKNLEYLNVFPGDFPFVRTSRKTENNWFVRQDIPVGAIAEANKVALDVLMKGVDSLGFLLNPTKEPAIDEIEKLMENIYAQIVEVNFVCGKQALALLRIYLQLIKKYNRDLSKIHGFVDFDPIGNLILKGNFYTSEYSDFEVCKTLIEESRHVPHFRTLAVNARYFKNAGSSIAEELAFGLAYGNEYLSKLTDQGLNIDDIAPKIKFTFATGSNYFMEIAKIRAARLLWAKIVNAYGPSDAEFTKTHIHTVTADWNKTMYDPHMNMLRTTTEAMSAIIGGTNSLTVRPYNAVFEQTSAFSERIARNQQLVIKEECYLDKVIDPAAGSYYLENLTDALVEEAWKIFLQIGEMGGFIEAFKKGFIQQRINETSQKRDAAIANRKEILIGTNQYPNFNEYVNKELDKSVVEPSSEIIANFIAEPLKTYRGAQGFELLRYKTDLFAMKNKRPKAFMFTFGSLAMRRARSQFSSNFFACAGFEVVDNNGFKTIEEGVAASLVSKAEIVVICGSDDDYPVIVPEIFTKIGQKAIVVVAGYPKDIVDELKAKGIKHFIHVKSNVLETLNDFQKLLNIA